MCHAWVSTKNLLYWSTGYDIYPSWFFETWLWQCSHRLTMVQFKSRTLWRSNFAMNNTCSKYSTPKYHCCAFARRVHGMTREGICSEASLTLALSWCLHVQGKSQSSTKEKEMQSITLIMYKYTFPSKITINNTQNLIWPLLFLRLHCEYWIWEISKLVFPFSPMTTQKQFYAIWTPHLISLCIFVPNITLLRRAPTTD